MPVRGRLDADDLVASPGLRREDIMVTFAEVAPENWWLEGRRIDPATGTDARMSADWASSSSRAGDSLPGRRGVTGRARRARQPSG